MGHEISEKEENTEKQNTGKIMVLENKECPICRTFVSQVFVTCARAVHTHTHITLYMDGRAFLTY